MLLYLGMYKLYVDGSGLPRRDLRTSSPLCCILRVSNLRNYKVERREGVKLIRVTQCINCPYSTKDIYGIIAWCKVGQRELFIESYLPDWCPLDEEKV